MKRTIPEFKSEAEEFEFWSSTGAGADSTRYVDWPKAKRARLPNLKPSLRTISVRLPVAMIEDLKIIANKQDVPYQTLLKVFLAERLAEERKQERAGTSGQISAIEIAEARRGYMPNQRNELFIEQRSEGDYAIRRPSSERASGVEQTQAEAIERAREIAPDATILVERVRNTSVGGRDKWRRP